MYWLHVQTCCTEPVPVYQSNIVTSLVHICIHICLQVNKEIVSGLKYVQQTFRKGVKSKCSLKITQFCIHVHACHPQIKRKKDAAFQVLLVFSRFIDLFWILLKTKILLWCINTVVLCLHNCIYFTHDFFMSIWQHKAKHFVMGFIFFQATAYSYCLTFCLILGWNYMIHIFFKGVCAMCIILFWSGD